MSGAGGVASRTGGELGCAGFFFPRLDGDLVGRAGRDPAFDFDNAGDPDLLPGEIGLKALPLPRRLRGVLALLLLSPPSLPGPGPGDGAAVAAAACFFKRSAFMAASFARFASSFCRALDSGLGGCWAANAGADGAAASPSLADAGAAGTAGKGVTATEAAGAVAASVIATRRGRLECEREVGPTLLPRNGGSTVW